jgi:hypothetical protein
MNQLNLSVAERQGIWISKQIGQADEEDDWQAVEEVMADRLISVEVIHRTLG